MYNVTTWDYYAKSVSTSKKKRGAGGELACGKFSVFSPKQKNEMRKKEQNP